MRALARCLFQRLSRVLTVRENVTVGRNVHIGPGSALWAPNHLRVEDDVYIGKRCTIEVDGVIGKGSLIANNVGIVGRNDHDMHAIGKTMRHAPWVGDPDGPQVGPVLIGEDVWIGYGAIILAPVTIGRGVVVAAGSLVTHDVEPYAVMVGVPARKVRSRFSTDEQITHERRLTEGRGI